MRDNAYSWGITSIGEQTVRQGEPIKVAGRFVLSIGYIIYTGTTGKETRKTFVLANKDPKNWDELEFLEFDYPNYWDVT